MTRMELELVWSDDDDEFVEDEEGNMMEIQKETMIRALECGH